MQTLRRFKNILAFSEDNKSYYAFNSNTMQVAEISNETWGALTSYTLKDSHIPDSITNNSEAEILNELETWNSEEPAREPLAQSKNERTIKSLTINVNQICNLKCTYCYANGDGTFGEPVKNISIEKTLPQLKFFLDRLPENSSFSIRFLGGEPLLYTDGILAIYEYIQSYKKTKPIQAQFSIVTNGTQFSDKNIEILRKLKAGITISLDGPPNIHDQFRKTKSGEGSSEIVIKGLEKLMHFKSDFSGLQFNGVFGKHNINFAEAYMFYRNYPVDYFKFYIDFFEKEEKFKKKFQKEFKKLLQLAYETGGESELRRITVVDQYFSQFDEHYKVYHHCGAGTNILAIDAKNRVFPCPIMVADKKYQQNDNEQLLQAIQSKFKENLIEQNDCNNCWARFICGGGCMYVNGLENNDLHKKSLNFCERTRFMILETLSFYVKIRGEPNLNEGESHETH